MGSGRIRRSAQRGVAAAVLGWLGVAAATVVMAPAASAEPAVTVPIRDLTPPAVSVDAGGTVTFVNEIEPKTVQVGGGGLVPALVDVTAYTDVVLTLPSGGTPLPAGASVTERFDRSCVTCTITYAYRLDGSATLTSALTDAALDALPPLPAPTPFVVNTIVPQLPTLPGRNLPSLPPLTLPAPPPGVTPAPEDTPVVDDGTDEEAAPQPGSAPQPRMADPPGNPYTYDAGADAVRLSPTDPAAAAAFDPSRFDAPAQRSGDADRRGAGGAGGVAGSYDGASVPVFGRLSGLDSTALDEGTGEQVATVSGARTSTLPAAALAAVVALATVTAALVRTSQAARGSR